MSINECRCIDARNLLLPAPALSYSKKGNIPMQLVLRHNMLRNELNSDVARFTTHE